MSEIKIIVMVLLVIANSVAFAQSSAPSQILIQNVQVFDGTSTSLSAATDVLITGNKIEKISKYAGKGVSAQAQLIDGGGRILMPGLIESHAHLSFAGISIVDLLTYLPSYAQIRSVADAEGFLMRGVTSLRDMGGAVFGLKRAIDEGIVPGPRVYPSGALLSQTSGHYDFRFQNQPHIQFGGVLDNLRIIIKDGKVYKNTL